MNAFEILRERVDLVEVAGRLTEMRPSGGGHVGRCPLPDHEDRDPSFHVYPDGRFHCFGCRRHGDVTDLWAAVRGIEPGIAAALDLAREYGVELPGADPNTRRLAEERRRKEAEYLEEAEAAHDALARHPKLAKWWEGRGFGEEHKQRYLLGAAEGAAVIPFWNRGRVQGLIRRNLGDGGPKYVLPKAEEMVPGHRPLFVPGPVREGTFLVEGYLDALALAALGHPVAAVGGTGISARQMDELRRLPGRLYVLPDDDEAGREAGRRWAEELYPKALLCPPDYHKKGEHHDDEE